MVLAHAEQALPPPVHHPVGVAPGEVRGEGLGQLTWDHPAQPLVGKVGTIGNLAIHRVRPAPVLVDAGAHIQGRQGALFDTAIGATPHQHTAPGLAGPRLDPADLCV